MMHGKWNVDRLCTEELCVSSCPHGPEACRKRSPCSSAPCWAQREDCHSSRTSFLKVAALLNITTSADTTVEVLKSQISPMVKELLSKPIPHPNSQSVIQLHLFQCPSDAQRCWKQRTTASCWARSSGRSWRLELTVMEAQHDIKDAYHEVPMGLGMSLVISVTDMETF